MSYRAFFLAALFLPIGVGYLGKFVPMFDGIYFLWQFAAIPYIISALVLAVLLMCVRSLRHIAVLSMCAPLLMSVAELVFLGAIDPPELHGVGRTLQLLASTMPMALIVGYVFVGITWGLFALARKIGLVAFRSSTPRG